ncbi:hypothetical protein AGLY_016140 [Aphis glycines]|uniref:Small ribosomal subunit protein eS31 domain-containing protein n=1 Tax=Aphis glycines TaxID=307491 RepID=A0A6G0SZL1_APHGL|nr:hypothetical protein AGLY_016140 [Aphis glycines]
MSLCNSFYEFHNYNAIIHTSITSIYFYMIIASNNLYQSCTMKFMCSVRNLSTPGPYSCRNNAKIRVFFPAPLVASQQTTTLHPTAYKNTKRTTMDDNNREILTTEIMCAYYTNYESLTPKITNFYHLLLIVKKYLKRDILSYDVMSRIVEDSLIFHLGLWLQFELDFEIHLAFHFVDENGKVHRLRKECTAENCGPGVFMAEMSNRFYCGKFIVPLDCLVKLLSHDNIMFKTSLLSSCEVFSRFKSHNFSTSNLSSNLETTFGSLPKEKISKKLLEQCPKRLELKSIKSDFVSLPEKELDTGHCPNNQSLCGICHLYNNLVLASLHFFQISGT